MKHNEVDSSIRFIRAGVPDFVRRTFEIYVRHQIKASDNLASIAIKSPYKANEVVHNIEVLPFIDAYKNIFIEGSYELHNEIGRATVNNSNRDDNTELHMAEGDIYAPLYAIEPIITTFTCPRYYDSIIPTVFISPRCAQSAYIKPSNTLQVGTINHDDIMGGPSYFDNLGSYISIDVNHLMTKFFSKINREFNKFESSINIGDDQANSLSQDNVKKFIAYKDILTSSNQNNIDIISKIVNDISEELTQSVVVTYLTYYGKMIGTKTSFFDWINGVFMKDLLKKLDMNSILTSNVSDISDNDTFCEDRMEHQANMQLQLGFVNWSFVIDTILHCNPNRDSKKKNKYAYAAATILEYLIENQFTTYNNRYIIGKSGPSDIKALLDVAIKRVYDFDNLSFIKSIKATDPDSIIRNNAEHSYNTDDAGLINVQLSTNLIADLFIKMAYLTMLDYSVAKLNNTTDEKEFYTGKSKRQIVSERFDEILSEVIRVINLHGRNDDYKIKRIITGTTYRTKWDEINKNVTSLVDSNFSGYPDSDNDDYDNNNLDNPSMSELKSIYRFIYDIRPNTFIHRIKNDISSLGIGVNSGFSESNDCCSNKSGYNESFNKEVHDNIRCSDAKFSEIINSNLLYKKNELFTLESLEQSVEEFGENSEESEWAYGNYDALSGMASNVIQVTNEGDNSLITGPTVDDMAATQNIDDVKENDSSAESHRIRINKLNAKVAGILKKKFK